MTAKRHRDPNETSRITRSKTGKLYNGRSHHALKYDDPEEAKLQKLANLPSSPNHGGPSDRMIALMRSGLRLKPAQVAGVRQGIVNLVEQKLTEANEVLSGTKTWSLMQTRLFLGMLDKVVPTMTEGLLVRSTMPDMPTAVLDLASASRAQLEGALAEVLGEINTINGDAKLIEDKTEKGDPRLIANMTPEKHELTKRGDRHKHARKKSRVGHFAADRLERTSSVPPPEPIDIGEDNVNRSRMRTQAVAARKKELARVAKEAMEQMAAMDRTVLGEMDPPDEPE